MILQSIRFCLDRPMEQNMKILRMLRLRVFRNIETFLRTCIVLLMISATILYIMDLKESTTQTVESGNSYEAFVRKRRDMVDDTDMALPLCELPAPVMVTAIDAEPTWKDLEKRAPLLGLAKGGRHKPKGCRARHKVAILVPYRSREVNLKLFLQHMHPFLQKQKQDYVIYVVEMEPEGRFRKTVIMNAGFLEVAKLEPDRCIVLHDVDMVPINTENIYFCDETIRHPAIAIKQYNFSKPYETYIGGVLAFPEKHYRAVNGFSNMFSGWGGEEDDLNARIEAMGINVTEPEVEVGKYATWPHDRQEELVNRKILVKTAVDRMRIDGLQTVEYTVRGFQERPLFTWIGIRTNNTGYNTHRFKPRFNDWLDQVHAAFTG